MKISLLLILFSALFLLPACSLYGAKQTSPTPIVQSPKPLAIPVGKNWQIVEEAPQLSDERGRLPFQTEQSVQPQGTKPQSPAEERKVKTQP